MESLESKLKYAVRNNDLIQAKVFLEAGADVHYDDEYYLQTACINGYFEMVKLLHSYGTNLHVQNDTVLLQAMTYRNYEIARYLIDNGANLDVLNQYCTSICLCSVSFIQYLLENGLILNNAMLNRAATKDCLETFKFMYDRTENIDLREIWTVAYTNRSFDVINYLLDLDVELDFTDVYLFKNILKAPSRIDILKKILNRVSDPKSILKPELLNIPCRAGDVETVKFLLELGLDPNDEISVNNNLTPLETACCCNHIEMAKLLLNFVSKLTTGCMIGPSFKNNVELFKLIFHSKEWSKNELCVVLEKMIQTYYSNEVVKFLLDEIDSDINESTLRTMVRFGLVHDMQIFDHLIKLHGKDRVLAQLEYGHLYGDYTKSSLEEMY